MYQRIWNKNENGIREEVTRLWQQRNNEQHTANSPNVSNETEKVIVDFVDVIAKEEENNQDVSTTSGCAESNRMDTLVSTPNNSLEDLSDFAYKDDNKIDNED